MADACSNNDKGDETRKNCEKLILNSLNDFNTNFKNYETAYSNYNPTSSDPSTANTLNADYQNMAKKLAEIETYVKKYTEKFLTNNDGTIKNSQIFYNEIIQNYNEMTESRKKLDQQLYDLYTNEYDSVYSNKPFVDSTVVTGIIWTALVTFMLYYVIVKM